MTTATTVSQKSNGESQMVSTFKSWQTPLTESERNQIRRMLKILETERKVEIQRQQCGTDKFQEPAPIGSPVIRTQGRTYSSLQDLLDAEFGDC